MKKDMNESLNSLNKWFVWFVSFMPSDLVGNLNCWFSHAKAHLICDLLFPNFKSSKAILYTRFFLLSCEKQFSLVQFTNMSDI